MASYIADRRLYVTADRSEVVEEGDPRAAFLLAGEGCQIDSDDVTAHDLGWKDGKIVIGARAAAKAAAKKAPKPEDKMAAAPENKAAGTDDSDEGTGLDAVDLEGLTKDDLIALAEDRGVEVSREDGEDGPPLKSDYIRALST